MFDYVLTTPTTTVALEITSIVNPDSIAFSKAAKKHGVSGGLARLWRIEPSHRHTDLRLFFPDAVDRLRRLEERGVHQFDAGDDDLEIEELCAEHFLRRGVSLDSEEGGVYFSVISVGAVGWNAAAIAAEQIAALPDNVVKLEKAPHDHERHLAIGVVSGNPFLSMSKHEFLPMYVPQLPDVIDVLWLAQIWGHDNGPSVRVLWSYSHDGDWEDHTE